MWQNPSKSPSTPAASTLSPLTLLTPYSLAPDPITLPSPQWTRPAAFSQSSFSLTSLQPWTLGLTPPGFSPGFQDHPPPGSRPSLTAPMLGPPPDHTLYPQVSLRFSPFSLHTAFPGDRLSSHGFNDRLYSDASQIDLSCPKLSADGNLASPATFQTSRTGRPADFLKLVCPKWNWTTPPSQSLRLPT